MAALGERRIVADDGKAAWDNGSYDFLLDGQSFESIHPSLQRQALLNMEYGLYEVLPVRNYLVRGFDLANSVAADATAPKGAHSPTRLGPR